MGEDAHEKLNAGRKPCVFFVLDARKRKEGMLLAWRETLCPRLSERFACAARAMSDDEAANLIELRVRVDRPVEWVFCDGSRLELPSVNAREIEELLAALSGYALYACERQMADGFIPLPGGHRAGVCGRFIQEDGKNARMSAISSVCVRIARHVQGASRPLRAHLLDEHGCCKRLLLLGPPGCGKTTALRDAALWLSDECGLHIGVADERQELFAFTPTGSARLVDVLLGASKPEAVRKFLRSMAPDVIVTDEIGQPHDVGALLDAARCGVGLLASAHAGSMEDAMHRPALRALFDARAFDRYALLGKRAALLAVWDTQGRLLTHVKGGGTGCPGEMAL